MTIFWKVIGGMIIASVMATAVSEQKKDMALLVTAAASLVAMLAALQMLEPVLEYMKELESSTRLSSDVLRPLMKILGTGIVTVITESICTDSGNASLARSTHLIGASVMLSMSIPIMESFMDLIHTILGGL